MAPRSLSLEHRGPQRRGSGWVRADRVSAGRERGSWWTATHLVTQTLRPRRPNPRPGASGCSPRRQTEPPLTGNGCTMLPGTLLSKVYLPRTWVCLASQPPWREFGQKSPASMPPALTVPRFVLPGAGCSAAEPAWSSRRNQLWSHARSGFKCPSFLRGAALTPPGLVFPTGLKVIPEPLVGREAAKGKERPSSPRTAPGTGKGHAWGGAGPPKPVCVVGERFPVAPKSHLVQTSARFRHLASWT